MESAELNSPQINLNLERGYFNPIESRFTSIAWGEGFTFVTETRWITRASLDECPGEVLGRVEWQSGSAEALARTPDGIAHFALTDRSVSIRAAASSLPAAQAVIQEALAALPEVDGDDAEVPVHIWWWHLGTARELARMLPAVPWTSGVNNYVGDAASKLDDMNSWRQPPSGGRLVLWHGAPGTGKTTAVRSLAGSWRDWAEFHFITDPEQFLHNSSYLLETVSSGERSMQGSAGRWRILVLEDAGEFLVPDAKSSQGQAMSRLLNVSDGVLGQATQTIVLITTNEPLSRIHPALSRPGRCLVDIEFRAHNAQETLDWCDRRDLSVPDGGGFQTLAELFAHEAGRSEARRALDFGFSGAP